MSLSSSLSSYWKTIQGELFPFLEDAVGASSAFLRILVTVLELVRLESFVPHRSGSPGRPQAERAALARAFVAKAVFNFGTTRMLIDRLRFDKVLRRICGWSRASEVPSEATFSRAFAEFAATELPSRVHRALIERIHEDRLVGHVSRDSTAIVGREKPQPIETKTPAPPVEKKPKRKPGRPRKGETRPEPEPEPPKRLDLQKDMTLAEMLEDLPRHCDVCSKRNAKGHVSSWIGYKLHIDTVDGDIPVSCILTSASVHDSQVALPLATMTAERLDNLYDLMDAAYDAPQIHDRSRSLGHVPMIAVNPRRNVELKKEITQEAKRRTLVGHPSAEDIRYAERTSAERVNANLKSNHGGETVHVRGPMKVACHLMFGILVIAATQIVKLVT